MNELGIFESNDGHRNLGGLVNDVDEGRGYVAVARERSVAAESTGCSDILETSNSDGATEGSPSMVRIENDGINADDWTQVSDEINEWSDAWLVTAVRRDPPDERALNVLAERYWKPLFARCQMLTLSREKASDLAQQAWCRVLRARHSLKPEGNFPAYLTTIATNLWRDAHRADLRAGPMAENRLVSLDRPLASEEGDAVMLGDALPDLNSLNTEEQKDLAMDLDDALGRLTPLLRDVMVARFVVGESCAEIGKRYNRTEQSVSGWIRRAIREMKQYLQDAHCVHACEVDL
jgi:RNA polymerase sigma-70 factor (ECF subfamily)